MNEIERFFSTILNTLLNRARYSAMDAAENKATELIQKQGEKMLNKKQQNQQDEASGR
ncbi:hypothetical protein [Anthocerotibacter panamensis]|uniref:hypothetical protein n=1 Tax=Anthocerotibacter panamensis TaxID=2857077 RepID=UPI001C402EBC|nr:hypothetical protein [Anthocerotibacter panamensis]